MARWRERWLLGWLGVALVFIGAAGWAAGWALFGGWLGEALGTVAFVASMALIGFQAKSDATPLAILTRRHSRRP
jgi:hypothetical protein